MGSCWFFGEVNVEFEGLYDDDDDNNNNNSYGFEHCFKNV